ncbi:ICE-like protease (caspase) p20 domain protein [Medicago truncatula]|uniref:ICE-like protease (Caspase) p20 domain protein n=1 Tax=Medicago truncatula TaxID=3880 RepID=G7IRV8_MEDTR|nr:ICE-like protease (caspase) p20 domain protein [Medicago truncatula]
MLDDERLNPTSPMVLNKLEDMILAMEDGDCILFYFCGHGGRYKVKQWSNNT